MLLDVDGVKLNHEVFGDGAHIVLCLPGLAGTIEHDFGKMLEVVDKCKFTWVAWDPPGYGKSRPPTRDFSDDYLRKDAILAAKLMEKLGYPSYSVIGWDQGGATALFLAAENPEAVVSVVTLGTHASYNKRLVQVYELLSAVELWPQEVLKEKVNVYGMDYLRTIMTDNMTAALLSNSSSEKGNYLMDCEDRIQCPTLHINGESDGIVVSGHAFTLESRVKRSRAEIIPEAGHDALLTHTNIFVDMAQEFFEKGE